jgi:hypothetical protein
VCVATAIESAVKLWEKIEIHISDILCLYIVLTMLLSALPLSMCKIYVINQPGRRPGQKNSNKSATEKGVSLKFTGGMYGL